MTHYPNYCILSRKSVVLFFFNLENEIHHDDDFSQL